MRKLRIRVLSALLAGALACGLALRAGAVADEELDRAVSVTAERVRSAVSDPQVGSVGGEWAVMGLARSGCDVPEGYYERYYATLEAYVRACGGVLHDKKHTEYSRVILAVTAIGGNPADVAGYNLLTPLGDYERTILQGLNGPIWALLALDSGDYPMPENGDAATQATREIYIDRILERQLSDGGFSLLGGDSSASKRDDVSDPDITGMALQALAKYQDRADVKRVTEQALDCMSKKQEADGGFSSWGAGNSESVVQLIVALSELGIPLDDPRFVKNGNTLLDSLMTYYREGEGFLHVQEGDPNQMATEQALYALVAAQRLRDGRPSLYHMTDALSAGSVPQTGEKPGEGLPGKHGDVRAVPVVSPGITFGDISGSNYHKSAPAIEALAARGIINGKAEGLFAPNDTMTRAEFSAIVVRGLGLEAEENGAFADVPSGAWYAGYVGTANAYGIVNGVGGGKFDPQGTITREDAALMVVRAAKLCGMDTERADGEARDTLAQFLDYMTVSGYAREAMAVCYDSGLLPADEDEIRPKEAVLRCEIAQLLWSMLGAVKLI